MSTMPSKAANASFRQYLPDISSPRFCTARGQSAHEYVDAFEAKKHPRPLYDLAQAWKSLLDEPFTGITTDGMSVCGTYI